MKRAISGVLAGMILIQPVFAQQSDTGVGVTVVPGLNRAGGNTGVYQKDGNYNFNSVQTDITALGLESLKQTQGVQEIDRKYMEGLAAKFTDHLRDLTQLKTKFQALGAESQTGRQNKSGKDKYVGMGEYVQQVLEINNKDQIIKNELQTLTLLTRENLPSYSPVSVDGKEISVATSGNVNTKAMVETINGLRAEIIRDINNVKFANLRAAANQFRNVEANALTLNLTGLRILEDDDRERLNSEMIEKRILKPKTVEAHQALVDKTVTLVNTFVTDYGTSEFIRFQDGNDAEAAKEAYLDIVSAFMRRSFLRKKFGIRIGAIQSRPYDKQKLGWEKYGLQLQPLKLAVGFLRREAAIQQEDVKKAFESARNFVEVYDEKTTEIFGKQSDIMKKEIKSEKYSSKDTGFMVRVNSTITTITGQVATAEVLLGIMRLILADAREEMALFRNANDEVAALSDGRYRITPEMKTSNNKEICSMDWTIPAASFQANCVALGVKVQPKAVVSMSRNSGVPDIFSFLLGQYRNIESARWQEASNFQKQLDADLESGVTPEERALQNKQDQEAADDLFK